MNLLRSLFTVRLPKWLPLLVITVISVSTVQADTTATAGGKTNQEQLVNQEKSNQDQRYQVQRYQVQQQRNPDYACTQCHKPETSGLHGKHASAINPNNLLPVTCTNCHGNISLEHRNGVADAMRFDQDMFRVDQQNSVCMSCHEPKKLREVFWQHDVHMMKLSCASCHNLHPVKDPMQGLDHKGQIKLCVDCHSEQHKEKGKP